MIKDIIKIHPNDNVAITLIDRLSGDTVSVDGQSVTLKQDIGRGHKIALDTIEAGENVMKYGAPIGHATTKITVGEHIHTHNTATNLSALNEYEYHPEHNIITATRPDQMCKSIVEQTVMSRSAMKFG